MITPGDWEVVVTGYGSDMRCYVKSGNTFVCNCYDKLSNAQAISAVPEMLAALKTMIGRLYTEIIHHPEPGSYRSTLQDELKQLEKILEEAEGKK